MDEALKFEGRVGSYELTVLANSQTIQFHYYLQSQPTVLYEALFYKQIDGSTSPEAARQMLEIFKSFKKMLVYIKSYSQDQRRISIASAGYVTIAYFKTKVRPKKCPMIEFDGQRLMSEAKLKQEKQVRSEVIDVRAENAFLKETLTKIEYQCQLESIQIQKLRQKILMSKKYYLKELRADAKMLKREQGWEEREDKRSTIKQLEQTIKGIKETVREMIEQVGHSQLLPEPEELEQQNDFQTLEKYGMKHWVQIDLNNQYLSKHFAIDGNTLRKIQIYFSCQVLGKDPFPMTGRHYYSVFIEKTTASIFSVGVVCQSRRNYQRSVDHEDCIAFFARNGTVWQERVERGGGPPVPNGVELRVVLDWVKDMVKWYQDGTEIASTMISKHLKGKRLVPYIQLNFVGDQVTFNKRRQTETQQEKAKQ